MSRSKKSPQTERVAPNALWPVVRLGDATTKIGSGSTPRGGESVYRETGVPLIRSMNVHFGGFKADGLAHIDDIEAEKLNNVVVQAGDVLLNITGASIGRVTTAPDEMHGARVNQHVCIIRPNSEISSRFLALYFASPEQQARVMNVQVGATRQALTKAMIERWEVPVPPLPDQRQIVAEIEKQFTRLDAGVAALRRVQANLKRYRAAVLKAACEGRLVPTEADLARKERRTYESGELLLQQTLERRRKKWSGRGKYAEPQAPKQGATDVLPTGWTWATFEQLSERVTVGFVGSMKHEYVESGVPFLRGQNVRENRFDPTGLLYVSEAFHQSLSKSALRPGDLAVVRSGGVGVTCVIPSTLKEANCSDLVLVQRPLGFVPQYGAYYMNSLAKRHVEAGKVGVALTHFNTKSVAALAVPLPPLAEQKRIVAEVDRRLSVIDELEAVVTANLARAIRLRQSVLQKAFTGALVPQAAVAPAMAKPAGRPLNRHFARVVLSAEIVHHLHAEPTFGRVKHQKIFHLCEHIARLPEIEGRYHRDAAGPLDNRLIYANEGELKRLRWYQEVHRPEFGHAYEALAKAGGHAKYLEGAWADRLPVIRRLIELMRKWDTERCEIFSTAYAAWNDLVIWKREPTEEAILSEVLHRWHVSKQRISPDRWRKAIAWMRKEGFAPTGFGRPTAIPQST